MNLNQITIAVSDFDASVAFYQKIGMTMIVHSPQNQYARFESPAGDSTFSIHVTNDPPSTGASLCFEVVDVDKRVKELKNLGIDFETEPTDQRWLWREAWTRDPDGYRIGIYHAGENRKHPPWRIESEGNNP